MKRVAILGWTLALACGVSDTGTSRSPLSVGPNDPRCPGQPPSAGATCDPHPAPLECEYGGDRFGRGTTIARCATESLDRPFTWHLIVNAIEPNPPACPQSFAEGMMLSAPPGRGSFKCEYDEGICATVCSGSSTFSWRCRARDDVTSEVTHIPEPHPLPNCSPQRPLAGSGCEIQDRVCNYAEYCGYSLLSFGPSMGCLGGYWHTQFRSLFCSAVACE